MHYNQDYLVHPTRTDFTGGNGVGKSIIADLLQLIFVHEPKLIKFGTKSSKDIRKYYTLPKDANEAFAFLNIEVFDNQFITIGVCIPNKKGKPIRPFVITKNVDLDKNIKDLVYRKDEWITSNHFIKNKDFLDIAELSKHLRDEYKLYLKYFTKHTEKDKYYSFLFEKEIIPINLGREDNRKTFAKIIQSFSKANALDVDNSNDLKQYIFEDSKQEYQKQFDGHKSNFEEQIQKYQENKRYIEDLTEKQEELSELKQKENDKKEKTKKWSEAEVRYLYHAEYDAFTAFDKIGRKLKESLERQSTLEEKVLKVGEFLSKIKHVVDALETSVKNFRSYKEIYGKHDNLKREKQELIDTNPPNILEKIEKQIDINNFGHQEIKRRINEFKAIYEEYGSVAAMRKKVSQQKQIIDDRKRHLNAIFERINTIIEIINNRKADTLFSKILEKGDAISEAQETILFNLIDVNWNIPSEVKSGARYTDTLDILNKDNIKRDKNERGFWLKTGNLHEFIPFRKEQRLFDNANNIKQAISDKKTELEAKVIELNKELSQIERFEQGKNSDKLSIDNNELDEKLYGYDTVNDLEKTAKIIQNLNTIITDIDDRLKKHEIELKQKKDYISFDIDDNNLDELLEKYEKELEEKRGEKNKLISQEANVKADLKSLKETAIPIQKTDANRKEQEHKSAKLNYTEKLRDFEKNFPNIAQDFDKSIKVSKDNVSKLKEEKTEAEKNYIIQYEKIAKHFQETKNRNHAEINKEIDSKNYDFTILEKVLLGQVKHVDNIEDKLKSLNDEGIKILKNIYAIMLKVFKHTKDKYDEYHRTISDLNTFFKHKDRRINKRYFLKINFTQSEVHKISWLKKLHSEAANIFNDDELFSGNMSVEEYVENLYAQTVKFKGKIGISELLDPQIYFDLKIRLTDENGNETGSTGQTYASIIMLGIARLSIVETRNRKGIRFIILEETASLDKTNFKTFPNIAKEFGYQIFTMTPEPYNSDATQGWYLYGLLRGTNGNNINHEPLGYFRTNQKDEEIDLYIQKMAKIHELDDIKEVA